VSAYVFPPFATVLHLASQREAATVNVPDVGTG
jgi:hypothetical protein